MRGLIKERRRAVLSDRAAAIETYVSYRNNLHSRLDNGKSLRDPITGSYVVLRTGFNHYVLEPWLEITKTRKAIWK